MDRYGIDEDAKAKRMLARAEKILKEVDESFIVTRQDHSVRSMPLFRPEEISLGKVLGKGGFGVVNEISKFTLDPNIDKATSAHGDSPENSSSSVHREEDASDVVHVHYDVKKARKYMENKAQRRGEARYALKRLHSDLSAVELARGMIDLAVEAKYLSVVWHPNIIKLRGLAKGEIIDKDFFIILDRLHETLDGRIKSWRRDYNKHGGWRKLCSSKSREHQKYLMIERMTAAYDLAAAFFYLHENRLVYRDIKPENIGFDIRGDVKVFDFGLAKSLSPHLKARGGGYGYRLTGRAGSIPYMAPEVVKMETYDTKVDVYSFAILLWEILALRESCKGMSPSEFVDRIIVNNERFPIQKSWPPLTRLMIQEAWDVNPSKRPDMKRVAIILRGDLNDMTNDDTVLRRTNHMQNRSNHSIHGDDFMMDSD